MPPRIIAVLARLRQDLAACLAPEAIRRACRDEGHRRRDRALGPVATVYLLLLQVLHGNTARQHVVHFGRWTASASAYCRARKRLPPGVLHRLLEAVAGSVRGATAGAARRLGHRVWVVDGSSFSMPDTPALQAAFGRPAGQREGCGFPVAKWTALFDVATGMLLRSATAPLRAHEMARCAGLSDEPERGDVVPGDRGFCSYAHLALLAGRGLHAVFRIHQKRIVDFTPGRPEATPGPTRTGCRTRAGCSPAARPIRSSSGPRRSAGRRGWRGKISRRYPPRSRSASCATGSRCPASAWPRSRW